MTSYCINYRTIIIQPAACDIISVVRLCYLPVWVDSHTKIKVAMSKICHINPLTINVPLIDIVTVWRNALRSAVRAVEHFMDSFVTYGVFETEACLVAFANFLAVHRCWIEQRKLVGDDEEVTTKKTKTKKRKRKKRRTHIRWKTNNCCSGYKFCKKGKHTRETPWTIWTIHII